MLTTIIISCFVLTITGLPVNINPELNGGGFEGDILFPPNSDTSRGAAFYGNYRRWPNKIIPYDISAITTNDRTTIINAMNQLMYDVGTPIPGNLARQVCVFFRPAEATDKEVLKILYGNGCSASIGYSTNYQKTLNLQQSGCFHNGIIQHELAHVLGFFHEQSRPDRDSFITVNHANISPGQIHNFEKHAWGVDVEYQDTSYDYGSLMHYDRNSFSINGKPTITPIQNNVVIGQREKLSSTDILEVRRYYGC
ncbi:unnamed protein product [Adineta steineri]|uniref:Metalloendopeptidase n=2 Tax=Adineta steineri TaxID=433720 RepID=A0A813MYJ9_9BILA|nr:unnamed protein product [Adineta steineri]